jgi:hypothetical protein
LFAIVVKCRVIYAIHEKIKVLFWLLFAKKCILGSYLWFIRLLNTNSNH